MPDYFYIQQNRYRHSAKSRHLHLPRPSALLSWVPPGQKHLLGQFSSANWCCPSMWASLLPSAAVTVCLRAMPAHPRQVLTPFTEHDSRIWTSTACCKEGWSHLFASPDGCQPACVPALAILTSRCCSDRGITALKHILGQKPSCEPRMQEGFANKHEILQNLDPRLRTSCPCSLPITYPLAQSIKKYFKLLGKSLSLPRIIWSALVSRCQEMMWR